MSKIIANISNGLRNYSIHELTSNMCVRTAISHIWCISRRVTEIRYVSRTLHDGTVFNAHVCTYSLLSIFFKLHNPPALKRTM